MKRRLIALIALSFLAAGPLYSGEIEPLTPSRYTELTIARLEMVKTQWTYLHRNPNEAELQTLWHRFGTTPYAFAHYRAANARKVDAYLAAHPEFAQRINELSEQVYQLIRDASAPPPQSPAETEP